jgi:signal transduction histidine kinase
VTPETADPWQAEGPAGAVRNLAVPRPLRILMLEDEPTDAELEQRLLKRAGLDFTAVVVDTQETFEQQLDSFQPDVILSDYSLPGFSGQNALKLTRAQHPDVPFIFLSGALGDETAVELLRQGATDYVLKDRPARLAEVIQRAVGEAEQRAQRARLEAQLAQAGRLESLGQLAGGVAHDFNNLLGIITNYMSFIGAELAKKPPEIHWAAVRADIAEVETAAQRATDLTRQLLAFGRREVRQPSVLSINDAVTDARPLLLRTLGQQIALDTVLAADPGLVFADPRQIEQVLISLAVNSRDAMPTGGRLAIETANAQLDAAAAAGQAGLHPGSYVSVRVSDTGTGIPPEVIDRVFEPFFTTKDTGAGTGLGLATVYGIITRAGGAVRVESPPGQGTTVTVLLPVTDSPAGAGQPPAAEPRRGAGTVLLVEDEPAAREMVRRVLDRGGYRVLTAASGRDALAMASETGQIDVLLTDVMMPNMTGSEVAGQIRARCPGVRVLFMSGYPEGILSDQGVLEPGVSLIQKPFAGPALLARLKELELCHPPWPAAPGDQHPVPGRGASWCACGHRAGRRRPCYREPGRRAAGRQSPCARACVGGAAADPVRGQLSPSGAGLCALRAG